MTLGTNVVFDAIVEFLIYFEFSRGYQISNLLASPPVMYCEGLWNFSLLRRIHISSLVMSFRGEGRRRTEYTKQHFGCAV
jgi:hypothetical protein